MLFFMATGFLFWSKLIRGESGRIDWTRLYVSRVLRLAPLFWCAVALLLAVVAKQSQWQLVESPLVVGRQILYWLTFNVLGVCDINGIHETWRIVAGVTWTLKYEWFFYLSLPAFGLFLGKKPPFGYLVLSLVVCAACFLTAPSPYHLGGFFGGIAASYLVRSKRLCNWATSKSATLLTVGAVGATVSFYGTGYATVPLLLLSFTFAVIACGNNLCGVLTNSAARKLGEISYSS